MFVLMSILVFFFFQAEDGIRDLTVTGVQTCALPISAMKNSDNAKAAALLPVVRTKMADLIKSMGPGAWRDLAGVLAVYTATRDPVIEQHVLQFVTRADLSKKQLKEEVATVLPDLAAKARAERELQVRSEEHTSELQSQSNLVCRLLLEKKKKIKN